MAANPLDRLPPHPLVIGLAAALGDTKAATVVASSLALETKPAKEDLKQRATADKSTPSEPDGLAKAPVTRPVDVVAGYIGGCVEGLENAKPMQVLYLDARLATWLLVRLEDIALFNRVKDDSAAFGERDLLWLRPGALVVRGADTDAIPQRYLNGPFVSVGDLEPTVSGGTFPRTGGLLDEATTPGCCTKTKP